MTHEANADEASARCPECGDVVLVVIDRGVVAFADHWDAYAERCVRSGQPFVRLRYAESVDTPQQVSARKEAYGARKQILKSMGFASYQAYLASDLWKRIRARVLAKSSKCSGFKCGKRATQVHHGKYGRRELSGDDLTHLYPVCGGCHFRSEFGAGRVKLTPHQATNKLLRRRSGKRKTRRQGWDVAESALALKKSAKRMRLPTKEAREALDNLEARRKAFRPRRNR